MIIIGVILTFLFLILIGYGLKTKVPQWKETYIQSQIEKAVKEKDARIKELNHRIAILSKDLFNSKKKYTDLTQEIRRHIVEAEAIKSPETRDETLDRFNKLGLKPVDPQ